MTGSVVRFPKTPAPTERPVSLISQILDAWDKADKETRQAALHYLQSQIDVKRGE